MLITQYAAAKQAGVTKQAIHRLSKKVPKPLYFIELKDGWKIDDDHQLWKAYKINVAIKLGKIGQEQKKFKDLLQAVVETIKEWYSPTDQEVIQLQLDINSKFERLQKQ